MIGQVTMKTFSPVKSSNSLIKKVEETLMRREIRATGIPSQLLVRNRHLKQLAKRAPPWKAMCPSQDDLDNELLACRERPGPATPKLSPDPSYQRCIRNWGDSEIYKIMPSSLKAPVTVMSLHLSAFPPLCTFRHAGLFLPTLTSAAS